jgi:hypothetical protein
MSVSRMVRMIEYMVAAHFLLWLKNYEKYGDFSPYLLIFLAMFPIGYGYVFTAVW